MADRVEVPDTTELEAGSRSGDGRPPSAGSGESAAKLHIVVPLKEAMEQGGIEVPQPQQYQQQQQPQQQQQQPHQEQPQQQPQQEQPQQQPQQQQQQQPQQQPQQPQFTVLLPPSQQQPQLVLPQGGMAAQPSYRPQSQAQSLAQQELRQPLLNYREGQPAGPPPYPGEGQERYAPERPGGRPEDKPAGGLTAGGVLGNGDTTFVAHMSNAMLGIGMIALPKVVSLLGWPLGLSFIVVIALCTYSSIQTLARVSAEGGHATYAELVRAQLGTVGQVLLELALLAYCFGMMLIYFIIIGDITVGDAEHEGGLLHGWEFDRPTVLAVLAVIVLAPVLSFRRMNALAGTSILGFLAILIWSVATLVLAVMAVANGMHAQMHMRPDRPLLLGGWWQQGVQVLAVAPVVVIAYNSHMAVHHVMVELAPRSTRRLQHVVTVSMALCTALYVIIALCSYAVFGDHTRADVLTNFTLPTLTPILGDTLARATYLGVRVAFLVSLVASFPMQMWPCRDALWRLLFRQQLQGPGLLLVTYLILFAAYSAACTMLSVWGPLTLVGSTAGVLLAFVFPALITLRIEDGLTARSVMCRAMGWTLLLVGIVIGLAGIVRLVALASPVEG